MNAAEDNTDGPSEEQTEATGGARCGDRLRLEAPEERSSYRQLARTARAAGAAWLLIAGACGAPRGETYGFVAVLGNDTTSVERVTRTRDHIVSDAVGRSPEVTRRHWEAALAPDGTVERWSLDTDIPNAPAGERRVHHTADFTGRGITLSRRTATGTKTWAYQKQFATTVPWNAFVYGTYELLLDAVRRHPEVTRIGQYFFEGWEAGHLGYADVVRQPDGSYVIGSTGLAGTGRARVDSSGRMLSYSGAGTTDKEEVHRVDRVPDIDSITTRWAAEEQRTGVPSALSPRDTVRATVGAAALTIDYGRPARRGRTLVGGLIPSDHVWRTGANAATQLTTTAPIELAGTPLRPGTYTLWTLPTAHGVALVINAQSGQWGTEYNAASDIARRPMAVDSLAKNVELFTIRVMPDTVASHAGASKAATSATLVMEWGAFRWSAPIRAES